MSSSSSTSSKLPSNSPAPPLPAPAPSSTISNPPLSTAGSAADRALADARRVSRIPFRGGGAIVRGLGKTRRYQARGLRRRTQLGLLRRRIQAGTAARDGGRRARPAHAVTCLPLLRRRRHLVRAEIDPHLVSTEAHAILGQKGRPPHPLPLDLRAIRRGQVADHQQPVGLHQQAMPLRQTRMLDHHVAVFVPAQKRNVPQDRNRWITILGNQFRFHRSFQLSRSNATRGPIRHVTHSILIKLLYLRNAIITSIA